METRRERLLVATGDELFFGSFAAVVDTQARAVERVDLPELPRRMSREQWDLVVVDLDESFDHRDFILAIPAASDTAVIAVVDDDDVGMECLQLGVNDYVRKPVSLSELAARAAARLAARPHQMLVHSYGDLTIDPQARTVQISGEDVGLAPIEFDLLAFLASQPNVTFSRRQLLDRVWASAGHQDVTTVTEHIYRLRRKIEPDPSRPRWLVTVRSAGYRFQP